MNVVSKRFHVSEAAGTVWEVMLGVAEQEVLTELCWSSEGFFSEHNSIDTKAAHSLPQSDFTEYTLQVRNVWDKHSCMLNCLEKN